MTGQRLTLAALAAALLLAACFNDPDDRATRRFMYTGRDSTGSAVVTGTLTLLFWNMDFPTEILGSWKFDRVGDGEVGPQAGAGDLHGTVDAEGNFQINLNPAIADQNVFLTGRFEADMRYLKDFQGRWRYETLSGTRSAGSFKAAVK